MSKISNSPYYGLKRDQALACRMILERASIEQIVTTILKPFNEDGEIDQKKMSAGKYKIKKWMREPKFQEMYRTMVHEIAMPDVARALGRISDQIDDKNPWLANKAANDTLGRFYNDLMGVDENTVTVRVEGMPELGTPDGEDDGPERDTD